MIKIRTKMNCGDNSLYRVIRIGLKLLFKFSADRRFCAVLNNYIWGKKYLIIRSAPIYGRKGQKLYQKSGKVSSGFII